MRKLITIILGLGFTTSASSVILVEGYEACKDPEQSLRTLEGGSGSNCVETGDLGEITKSYYLGAGMTVIIIGSESWIVPAEAVQYPPE